MEIGLIGLGRMGQGIARRLLEKNFRVMGFDFDADVREAVRKAIANEVHRSEGND